jgi:hypothetical protein
MWRLKSCPRCGGDMCLEEGPDGQEEKCLQCSYVRGYEAYPAPEKGAQSASEPVAEDGGVGSEDDQTSYDKDLEIFLYSKSGS